MCRARFAFGVGIEMKKIILLLSSTLACACSHTTVTREESVTVKPNQEYGVNFFLWTTIPGARRLPPASKMCPQGRLETLDFATTGVDALIAVVTLGIYIPQTVMVGCSNKTEL